MLGTIVLHLATAVPQIYPGLEEVNINLDAKQVIDDGDVDDSAEPEAQGRQIGTDLIPAYFLGDELDDIKGMITGDTGDADGDGTAGSCVYGTSKISQFGDMKNKIGGVVPMTSFFGTTLASLGGITLFAASVLGGLAAFGLLPLAGIGTALTTAIAGLGFGDGLAREGFVPDNRDNHIHAVNEHHQFHENAQQKLDDYYYHQQ